MKRILYILMIGLFTSCDGLLDVEPEILVGYDHFFQTEQDLEVTLYQMQDYLGAKLLDFRRQEDAGFIEDGDYRSQLYLWNPVDMLESITTDWEGTYNVVYMSNVLLDNLDKASKNVTPERLDFYRAQAYFGKAMAYFFISRRWGEAPITRNSTSSEVYGKRPYLEVIDTVIANATRAYHMLPVQADLVDRLGKTITSKQFGSKGNACALLAHAYAWKGSLIDLLGLKGDSRECYTESIKYATNLIKGEAGNYSLVRDPEVLCELFSDNTANNPESIFEFTLDTQTENIISVYMMAGGFVGYPVKPEFTEDNHSWKASNYITYSTIEALYDEGDARKTAYFNDYEKYKIKYGLTGYAFPYKWRKVYTLPDPDSPTGEKASAFKSNLAYWRLSDFYLLRAECNVKLGNDEPAVSDLNEIRGYNNAELYPNSKGDEKGLQYAIFHERERELLLEGHRFYDVVRNGVEYVNAYLPGNLSKLTANEIKQGALFLSIYDTAFDFNDLLVQNDYWAQFE